MVDSTAVRDRSPGDQRLSLPSTTVVSSAHGVVARPVAGLRANEADRVQLSQWRVQVTYSDQVLACVDCGTEFVFSASEQSFFAEKGFTSPPKRCPSCRAQRRASGGFGGSSYGSGGGYGSGYDRGPREMHDAVCARCGKETQVPFKPTGTRPVYCSDCFRLVRG
jgi:CxxC-x17-CxxC domain-containing protein